MEKNYFNLNQNEILAEKNKVRAKYEDFKKLNLKLDMSRGKPCTEQLDLSVPMLKLLDNDYSYSDSGIECRNYGELCGIPGMKKLMAEIMEVLPEDVIVGGNSSLSLMFDVISCFMNFGINNSKPWKEQSKKIKFLCPSPGYDRHFAICEYFGMELICIKMTKSGPEMDEIEKMVYTDDAVKGIWCVPKYSNPSGTTYSDETVKRLANLKPAAKDFRIFWDNAYAVHELGETPDLLLNIMDECKKTNNSELPIIFCSTSKITFAGGGVAALACHGKTLESLKKFFSFKTIGGDKINQLQHLRFLKNLKNIKLHMQKHTNILVPKFELVLKRLREEFENNPIISWSNPNGGYFISVEVHGCAKRIVSLCKDVGLIITPAGVTFPYGRDLCDSNIRIAPTFPKLDELKIAINVFIVCVKLAVLEKNSK